MSADAIQERFDRVSASLSAAAAFCRLLSELDDGEDGAGEPYLDEPKAALAELSSLRRAPGAAIGPGTLQRLRDLELRCADLLTRLSARDEALSPSALRLCLRPGSGIGNEALRDLIRFYLLQQPEATWTEDRIDKVDLLITKLSESLGEPQADAASPRLLQVLASLGISDRRPPLGEVELKTFRSNITAIRMDVEKASSLDPLLNGGALRRYRSLKHRLGRLLLEPEVLIEIVRTNLTLREVTRKLYTRAETGMLSTLQGIFDMRVVREVDPGLRNEIDRIHGDFDRFEESVKSGNIRFREVEMLQRDLQRLFARLAQAVEEPATEPVRRPPTRLAAADESQSWLKEDLEVLLELIEEGDRSELSPAEAACLPAGELPLDEREVVAFRRLRANERCEPEFERFLLKAAALRRSIRRAARNMAASGGADAQRSLPAFERALRAVPLAETFLTRYSQAVNRAVLEGDLDEARSLQVLRMRLMREFSGIWLQVHQPPRP